MNDTRRTICLHIGRTVLLGVILTVLLLLCTGISAHAASAPNATGKIVNTDGDGVIIRTGPGTDTAKAGSIPEGGSVTVLEEKYTQAGKTAASTIWYYVNSSSYGTGYVRGDYISVTYESVKTTTTTALNVRTGPGTSFAQKTTLAKGASAEVVLTAKSPVDDTWYKIRYGSGYAYVYASYVNLGSSTGSGAMTTEEFEKELTDQGFPDSYKTKLRALHKQHPNWHFRAKQLSYTWADAFAEQTSNVKANLSYYNWPESYKAVRSGAYNFNSHTYYAMDSSAWVAASKAAVAYYMDPRNWLTESEIFMFEPTTYDPSYQTEALVKKILSSTKLDPSVAKYYIAAAQQTYNGKKYSISPVYLAIKTRQELGDGTIMIDGRQFTYGGETYSGAYNVYNIGCTDSSGGFAAYLGLRYAATGSNYLRPWNTLEKAIKGGALFIADGFADNNQYTPYYEHFNVLNGLSNVGTHVYATAINSPSLASELTYETYKGYGLMNEPFTFEIPVYKSMPSSPCAKPPATGNNNCYLDSITLSADGKTLSYTPSFNRFTSTYTVKNAVSADQLTIQTKKNVSGVKVTISGNKLKEGKNTVTIKCVSSSGLASMTYKIVVTQDTSAVIKGVQNTTLTASGTSGDGFVKTTWTKSAGYDMDCYQIFRAETPDGFGSTPYYTTAKGTATYYKNTKALVNGKTYYYKVRGVRKIDGKTYYSKWSNVVSVTYDPSGEQINSVQNTTLNASTSQGASCIQVTWTKSSGCALDCYEIFRSTDGTNFGTKAFYTTKNGTGTTYQNTGSLKSGTKYYYKVRGVRTINGTKYYTKWSNVVSRVHTPTDTAQITSVQNTTLKASSSQGANYIQVKWTKSSNCAIDYYEVFRSTDKNNFGTKAFYTTKNGTTTTYKNTGSLKIGTRYYYKVRGVRTISGKKYYTKWSSLAYRVYSPPNATLISGVQNTTLKASSSQGASYIQVKWTKSPGYAMDHYEVFRSTDKNSFGTKAFYTTKNGTATTYKNTGSLKVGTRYYYKVRGVRTINGKKYYTKWSSLAYRVYSPK